MKDLVLVGSGGHAKVVVSTARAAGRTIAAILDVDPGRHGTEVLGIAVTGDLELAGRYGECEFLLAFGSNDGRRRLSEHLGVSWGTLVHPSTVIDGSVEIQDGSVVMAGAIIQPGTVVGRQAIVNTGCTIDHDCRLKDFSHVAPGCHLSGSVSVGTGTLIGVGSCARPGVSVGDWSIVGAGSVIVSDLPGGRTCYGNPARAVE